MKTTAWFPRMITTALLICVLASAARAATLETLHRFIIQPKNPYATLIQAGDGAFYGTSYSGGTYDGGTVFKITTNGAMTPLWSFTGGANPRAGLVQASDGALYGTTLYGGANYNGTIFKITTNGAMTSLWSFTGGAEGAQPVACLVQARDGALYGTTQYGGTNYNGTIFKITTNGMMTPLWSFTGGAGGKRPCAGLVQAGDGALYGTTLYGGTNDNGTIFKITTNGAMTSLWSFTGGAGGANPQAGLVETGDGALYGTTAYGGTNGNGIIFKITTNGTMTPLWSFTYNSDGANPYARLVQASDGALYGTTYAGGTTNQGTIFKFTTNGVMTRMWSFTNGTDGANPYAGLVQASDGALYGTTYAGGTTNWGTIFKITTNGALSPLWSFTFSADGAEPFGGLVQAGDGALYGMTDYSGTNNGGTIFKMATNGVLTPLWSFTGGVPGDTPGADLVQGRDGVLYNTTAYGGTNGAGTIFKITATGAMTSLWSFTGGADGRTPRAGLVQGRDGVLYGTTAYGGTNDHGTIFKFTTNGVLTPLWSFTGGAGGENPASPVQAGDGALYGTTMYGGTNNYGTIFKITTNGAMTRLWSFTGGAGGGQPLPRLVDAGDGTFYGTTYSGGTSNRGTIFKFSTNGAMTSLWSFTGGGDGAYPNAGLVQAGDGALYGTTQYGGSTHRGIIFKITTNGAMTPLWSFTGGTNGAIPRAGLLQAGDGTFYGTTSAEGGVGGLGTVFRFTTNATGYEAWAEGITNGLTNSTDSATSDGYPNLLKYATGSSPTNSDDLAAMNGSRSNGVFAIRFHRNTNATDVTLVAEISNSATNNSTWNGLATNINGSWGGATNVIESGTSTPVVVTVRDAALPATNGFLRLRVTQP